MNAVPPANPAPDVALVETPAFVFDEATVLERVQRLRKLGDACGLRVLYSVKACPLAAILALIAPRLDGFSASSVFEARLAREALGARGSVHLTSPALCAADLEALEGVCDYLSYNSIDQWRRLAPASGSGVRAGLRVNPQRSLVADVRYDPCRPHSKLGVPLPALERWLEQSPAAGSGVSGLHFHTHHDSESYQPLSDTVAWLESRLPRLFDSLQWLNLGGGYLLTPAADLDTLARLAEDLRRRRGLTVFFEPARALVGDAACLIATVTDLFDSDGMQVAVLDTSVNHLPEVFEYQRTPAVAEALPQGPYRYLLAGGTCLAGDLFGEYTFAAPLAVGSRLTFPGVGAYTLVKAHRFNGHNLPNLYMRGTGGVPRLVKRYSYDDYRRQWWCEP